MDRIGSMGIKSITRKRYIYILVMIGNLSRYITFLIEKYEALDHFKIICIRVHYEKVHSIIRIMSDKER